MNPQPKSFWGLCQSCERIENRLFLEAVQKAVREDKNEFDFHDKHYSLVDPTFPRQFLENFLFQPSSQDPRLTLLTLCCSKAPTLFQTTLTAFAKDPGFLLSANLQYRSHLPNKLICGTLHRIMRRLHQRFLDLPSCPNCMARYLVSQKAVELNQRQVDHILSIFRNRVLSQHPTWFVSIFRLLQTIWEQDMEEKLNFPILQGALLFSNPVEYQIEFRDWMGAFLETPVVIEKYLNNKISQGNREFLQHWTGQTVNMKFVKQLQRNRTKAWKEDLYIKAWHPDRVFDWCMDLEDKEDLC